MKSYSITFINSVFYQFNKNNSVKTIFCCLFLFYIFSNDLYAQQFKLKTIVIDAGHGGRDPGALGSKTTEKKITLGVAKQLYKLITKNMPKVIPIMTRESDVFVPLYKRGKIANENKADLFISIHCNASEKKEKHGTETFTMGLHVLDKHKPLVNRENAVIKKENHYIENYDGFDPKSSQANIVFSLLQGAIVKNSLKFAEKVENNFKNNLKKRSRGVQQAGFIVLWQTTCPSVLIEIGFMTNKNDELFLSKKNNQIKIANAIFQAIKSYKIEIEDS